MPTIKTPASFQSCNWQLKNFSANCFILDHFENIHSDIIHGRVRNQRIWGNAESE